MSRLCLLVFFGAVGLVACGAAPAPAPTLKLPPAVPPSESVAPAVRPTQPLRPEDLHLALDAVNSTVEPLMNQEAARAAEKALPKITELLARARPEDRELLERGLALQREAAAHDETSQHDDFSPLSLSVLDRLIAIDRGWAALYPDDHRARHWLAKTLRDPYNSIRFRGYDEARLAAEVAEGEAIVRELAARYPDDPLIQADRADVCMAEHADAIECMRRYARCVELMPDMQACREKLDALRRWYTTPYCAAANVRRGFKVSIATLASGVPRVPIDVAKLTPGAQIAGTADVEEIVSSPLGDSSSLVAVRVSASRRDALKSASNNGSILLISEGSRRLEAVGAEAIQEDGVSIQFAYYGGSILEKVCNKISRRTLPPDLAPN